MSIQRERFERVCRMYNTNKDAARAAGMKISTFKRKCEAMDIETPARRIIRERMENITNALDKIV